MIHARYPQQFKEIERILRENEQLNRRAGCLEAQAHRLSEELRLASLQREWIAIIASERLRPAGE